MTTFYDKDGQPTAYTEDGEHIYLFSGEPVAFIDGNDIYNFNGKHLGWLDSGWIIDHDGECVFFTKSASGGAMKPTRNVKPVKNVKEMKPMKGMKEKSPRKPRLRRAWSKLSGEPFFVQ